MTKMMLMFGMGIKLSWEALLFHIQVKTNRERVAKENWNWTENKTVKGKLSYNKISRCFNWLISICWTETVWMWKQTNHVLARLARNALLRSFVSAVQDENNQCQMNNHEINDKGLYEKRYSSGWCNCLVGFFLNNLFGVDTKMLSKVLAHWQEQAGTHIIDADQAGFIKGWMSYHTTRCVFNVIHYLNHYQTPTAIVSIDTEKASKRSELEYVFETLKRFWFP